MSPANSVSSNSRPGSANNKKNDSHMTRKYS